MGRHDAVHGSGWVRSSGEAPADAVVSWARVRRGSGEVVDMELRPSGVPGMWDAVLPGGGVIEVVDGVDLLEQGPVGAGGRVRWLGVVRAATM